jgi:hypothetical protein
MIDRWRLGSGMPMVAVAAMAAVLATTGARADGAGGAVPPAAQSVAGSRAASVPLNLERRDRGPVTLDGCLADAQGDCAYWPADAGSLARGGTGTVRADRYRADGGTPFGSGDGSRGLILEHDYLPAGLTPEQLRRDRGTERNARRLVQLLPTSAWPAYLDLTDPDVGRLYRQLRVVPLRRMTTGFVPGGHGSFGMP